MPGAGHDVHRINRLPCVLLHDFFRLIIYTLLSLSYLALDGSQDASRSHDPYNILCVAAGFSTFETHDNVDASRLRKTRLGIIKSDIYIPTTFHLHQQLNNPENHCQCHPINFKRQQRVDSIRARRRCGMLHTSAVL